MYSFPLHSPYIVIIKLFYKISTENLNMSLLEAIFKQKNTKKRNLSEGEHRRMQTIISLRIPDKSSIDFTSLALPELHQTYPYFNFFGQYPSAGRDRITSIFKSLILHNRLKLSPLSFKNKASHPEIICHFEAQKSLKREKGNKLQKREEL